MYIILEMQTAQDGNVVIPAPVQKETLYEAEAAYHQILAAAALSKVYKHSATILTDEGNEYESHCYTHAE